MSQPDSEPQTASSPEVDPFADLQLSAFLADQDFQALRRRRRWQAIGVVIALMVIITLISL